jgi:hypothetical protein
LFQIYRNKTSIIKARTMKKTASKLGIILCLFLFQIPYSYCQDNSKDKPKKETNKEDQNDDENAPEEDQVPAKKTKNMPTRVTLALEGGADLTALNIGGSLTNIAVGGTIGGYADIRMCGQFYVQPGLFYLMNGGADVILYNEFSGHPLDINMIEVPVTVAYKTGRPGYWPRFTVGVGAYFGYNAEADINGLRLLIGNSSSDDIKATDIGVCANIGLELRNGIFFRIKSQRGLSNLRSDPTLTSIYSGSDAITIGYLFNKKARHHRVVRSGNDQYIERRM